MPEAARQTTSVATQRNRFRGLSSHRWGRELRSVILQILVLKSCFIILAWKTLSLALSWRRPGPVEKEEP